MKIAVAGATGRVGRPLVDLLRTTGHNVVAMSRSTGVDVISGEGLAAALSGVESVIDVTSGPSPEQKAATDFFTTASRNLQQAGSQAGVRRMIVISIIGIEKFSEGYMAAKVVHEKVNLSGPIPTRILRAAQFHEFVAQLIDWGRQGNVTYLPRMRTQLVAATTVAEALADLAVLPPPESPGTRPMEIAGPRAENLVDAAARLIAWRGDPLRVESISNPADPDRALYESGGLLPGPAATLSGPTFDEWLKSTPHSTARTGRHSA